MTAYEMQVLSGMIVEGLYAKLANDEKFARKIAKSVTKRRMLNTRQVAEKLGISVFTVREIAEQLGGIKGKAKNQRYGHLAFAEDGLLERYENYLRTK